MGIGSEGVCALRSGRRFVGVELKESYFKQAAKYIKAEDSQFVMALKHEPFAGKEEA
jgi:DNA modification methylase